MSLLQDFHHYTRDDPDDIYRHNSHVTLDTLNVLVSTKLISQIPLELSTYIIMLGFAHIHACQWAFKMIIRTRNANWNCQMWQFTHQRSLFRFLR